MQRILVTVTVYTRAVTDVCYLQNSFEYRKSIIPLTTWSLASKLEQETIPIIYLKATAFVDFVGSTFGSINNAFIPSRLSNYTASSKSNSTRQTPSFELEHRWTHQGVCVNQIIPGLFLWSENIWPTRSDGYDTIRYENKNPHANDKLPQPSYIDAPPKQAARSALFQIVLSMQPYPSQPVVGRASVAASSSQSDVAEIGSNYFYLFQGTMQQQTAAKDSFGRGANNGLSNHPSFGASVWQSFDNATNQRCVRRMFRSKVCQTPILTIRRWDDVDQPSERNKQIVEGWGRDWVVGWLLVIRSILVGCQAVIPVVKNLWRHRFCKFVFTFLMRMTYWAYSLSQCPSWAQEKDSNTKKIDRIA